jgi:hypothetical protein
MTLLHHQTLRLGRGAHASPAEGACVMELASLLGDESFSDRPECVSPVIGGFLRTYNDLLDDRRRQDLRPYAAAVVGSRGGRATEISRARRCIDWGSTRPGCYGPSLVTRLLVPRGGRLRLAGAYAGAAAWGVRRTEAVHRSALRFLDELIAIGSGMGQWQPEVQLEPPPQGIAPSLAMRGAGEGS